jgi:hypothetical protein
VPEVVHQRPLENERMVAPSEEEAVLHGPGE